jgi:hypothetical protein
MNHIIKLKQILMLIGTLALLACGSGSAMQLTTDPTGAAFSSFGVQ